jgi:excisionase family DNA binding protein
METLLDISELSGFTKIKIATLRKYVVERRVPFVKVGRLVRFRPAEIENWLNDCACKVLSAERAIEQPENIEGQLDF